MCNLVGWCFRNFHLASSSEVFFTLLQTSWQSDLFLWRLLTTTNQARVIYEVSGQRMEVFQGSIGLVGLGGLHCHKEEPPDTHPNPYIPPTSFHFLVCDSLTVSQSFSQSVLPSSSSLCGWERNSFTLCILAVQKSNRLNLKMAFTFIFSKDNYEMTLTHV